MPIILAFRRVRQEDREFHASLGYRETLAKKQNNKKILYREAVDLG
jgi:hypothetical protein